MWFLTIGNAVDEAPYFGALAIIGDSEVVADAGITEVSQHPELAGSRSAHDNSK